MLHRLLLTALLAVALAPIGAAQSSCRTALADSEETYRQGEFDRTIDRLTGCLDANAFSPEERRQAYRLVGLSYIGKDREADARAAVRALLEVSPNYQPDPAIDPPPFVRMVAEERRNVRPTTASGAAAARSGGGFLAALRAHGMGYSDADDDAFSGSGGDLTVGYGVTPSIAVTLGLAGSTGSGSGSTPSEVSLSLGEVSLGGRFSFGGSGAALVPYAGVRLAFQAATYELNTAAGVVSLDYAGGGGAIEGGVQYFFTRSLGIDAGLSATFASLTTEGREDAVSASTVRIGIGLAYRP